MQQLDQDHYPTQPETPDVRPAPGTKPLRVGLRRFSLLFFTVLLLAVLGIGLFAGWVYGTRSTSLNPSGTPATLLAPSTSGNALDTLRETIIEQARPAVVQVNVVTGNGTGLGSGVIIDPRGYLVTNAHVIADAQQIQVTLFDGASLPAHLVGTDPLDDLAVLKISPPGKLTTLPLGDSSKLRVGQEVLVIGNPLGITQSVTDGIVSALDRAVSSIPDAIQTDAAINPGNSGGALVNLRGELVGIPTLSAIDPQFQTPANGVGFAIPSNRVQFITTQLIETGKVTHTGRAAMGVQVTSVDAALAAQNHLAVTSGVLIVQVTAGSPAATAGLQIGDVIGQIGTLPVTDVATFADALLHANPGQVVAVTVSRGTQHLTLSVTLGEARTS